MNRRENLIRALKRQNPEYVPYCFDLCRSLVETFKKKTGAEDYLEYFDLPTRGVDILASKHIVDYSRYFPDLPDGAYIDEWGIGHLPGSVHHFEKMLHPMERLSSPEQIRDFPMPDVLDDYRWEGMNKRVKEIQEKGIAAIYAALQIFEPAWYLRGAENLLMDMIDNEDMAKACLDRMTWVISEMSRKVAETGVDMIIYGDDVGTQKEMMMSPSLWRKWLKPTMRKAIKVAKDVNPDVICYYHSDGVIYDIIPDLLEIGIDVLNPVQPECMDPVKLKEIYGDRLSFWGTIGTQTTMPFGTPEDVDRQVKLIIETVGKGGGLVIAPTHLLEPEVPWENIEAFVNAVKKYGRYN
jgi:uroporphyrinogen decarboxylase